MQSYNIETDWSQANDATQIYIYINTKGEARRRDRVGFGWICVGIQDGSQHRPSNLIGLIFRRGNDSSCRTLIGKLKK